MVDPIAREVEETEQREAQRESALAQRSDEQRRLRGEIELQVRREMRGEVEARVNSELAKHLRALEDGKKEFVPPHNLQAERELLGSLILSDDEHDGTFALVAPIVSAHDFHHVAHGSIYAAYGACFARRGPGEQVDVVQLSEELRARKRLNACGGLDYLASLAEAAWSTHNAEQHARVVADCAQRRRVIAAARETIERAARGGQSWTGDVSRTIAAALESRADSVPLLTLRERAGYVAERMTTRRGASPRERGLPTGLAALDKLTPGGLLPGQLIVLAGRPGLGKTSLFLQLALAAAASGKGCALLFSLEMETDELVERALCARALVDSARAADGVLSEGDVAAILEAVPQLEQLPVLFDPRSRLRMADVRARVLSVLAREPVAFVGLDYLQLLEEDGDAESREEAIARATRECKLLAKEAGVPFALLSQFNRANERDKRAPRISDLRGSGAIEQDADKVWMIHSEADDSDAEPEVEIIVGKQRKGPKGPARVRFVRALTVFRDVAASAADEWNERTVE